MTTPEQPETLLEFPCEYPLKAMGETSADFEAIVVEIVGRHVSHIAENAISSRQSSGGKFTSVTVTIQAGSRGGPCGEGPQDHRGGPPVVPRFRRQRRSHGDAA